MLLGIGLLVMIFAGFTAARKLAQVNDGLLQPAVVAQLIGLNTLISLEVLLPTALYLSIVSTMGRLYRDSEITALSATGISEPRILISILKFSLFIALIVAIISLFGRPWAYQRSYQLEAEAAMEFDINRIKPGKFLQFQSNTYVLFAQGIDPARSRLTGVFLEIDEPGKSKVIYAREASMLTNSTENSRVVEFVDGYGYLLDHSGTNDVILKFQSLRLHLPEDAKTASRKRKAISTRLLVHSDQPKEIAEYQWRLSTPVATLLLAMLAVPLSRSTPRKNRYTRLIMACIVYAVFFNLANVARNWLEQEIIGPMPGLWWVYGLALLFFLILFFWPQIKQIAR